MEVYIYIYQCYCLNSSHLSILLYVHSLFSISASPFFFYCGFFPVLLKCNWQINIISIYVYHIVHLKLTQWRVDYISINLGENYIYLDFLTVFHSFLPPTVITEHLLSGSKQSPNKWRKQRLLTESAQLRESTTIACILAETQRQAEKWVSCMVGKNRFQVCPDWMLLARGSWRWTN